MRKKIVIAIPTYNRRDYLLEALRSINDQTFKDIKLVIFDNASDYDIREAVKVFDKLDIEIEKNETNTGNLANFSKMYAHKFDADYVMIFHDDDTIHPQYIEEAVNHLDQNKDLVWLGSNLHFISDNSKMFHFKPIPQGHFKDVNTEDLILEIFKGYHLCYSSVIYNNTYFNQAVLRANEFDKWIDRPLLIDLSLRGKVALSHDKFINYRIHANQDSQNAKGENFEKLLGLFQYYKDLIKSKAVLEAFLVWATNNAINVSLRRSMSFKEFRENLSVFKKRGFFQISRIRARGVYYIGKFLAKKVIGK